MRRRSILRNPETVQLKPYFYRIENFTKNCVNPKLYRLTPREVAAVLEWEQSGTGLHCMRDHPLVGNRLLNYLLNIIAPLAYIVYLCMIIPWIGTAIEMIKPLILFIDLIKCNFYNLVN